MSYHFLTLVVALLATMAVFDIWSTGFVLTRDPQHFKEGNGIMAKLMHAVGIVPALILLRLPFALWGLTFCFPHAVSLMLPLRYIVAVADTPDWVFIAGVFLYGYVVLNNWQAVKVALANTGGKL